MAGAPAAPNSPNRIDNSYVMPNNVAIGDYRSVAEGGDLSQAAPENAGNTQYSTSPVVAWAPVLEAGDDGKTPSKQRITNSEGHDYRPSPFTDPPSHWWLGPGPGRENYVRTGNVENVDGDGWAMYRPPTGTSPWKEAADNPRRHPPAEPRPTNLMAPKTYAYTRPFDSGGLPKSPTKLFNGIHFSMADHRRNYQIYGMKSPATRRNTYRLDPAPWDQNIVDLGSGDLPVAQEYNARLTQVDVPPTTARVGKSWRLS
jgi:hypothetical protein